MVTKKNHRKGVFGLFLITIIWGSGFVATDIALVGLTTYQILPIRFLIATVIIGIIGNKKIFKIPKQTWRHGLLMGIFLFAGFYLQTIGLEHTTPSKNAFITAVNVVIVPFIAMVIYKKKVLPKNVIAAVLTLIGVGLLSLDFNQPINIGDFYTLLCAIGFAFHIFLTGVYAKTDDGWSLTFVQLGVASVISLAVMLIKAEYSQSLYLPSIYGVIYLGVFSTCIAFFIQTMAQKYTRETESAIILSFEAVFATIFSVLLLGEDVTIKMLVGCVVILSSVMISET